MQILLFFNFFLSIGLVQEMVISNPTSIGCELPIAYCTDINVELPDFGMIQLQASQVDTGSIASCGIDSIFLSVDIFDCVDFPVSSAYLIVSDSMGQVDSCAFTITLSDTIAPVLSPIPDTSFYLEPLHCSLPFQIDFVHDDNCFSEFIIQDGPQLGDELVEGEYTCEWYAIDGAGNERRDTFVIQVLPPANQSSSLVCDEDIQINLDESGTYELLPDFVLIGGPYGCIDNYIIEVEGGDNNIDCTDVGEVTATLEDITTGNFCTISISVNDNYLPNLISLPSDTFDCFEGIPTADDPLFQPVFEDNCGLDDILMVSETTVDDDICDGMRLFRRSWVATDINNNTSPIAEQLLYVNRISLLFPPSFVGLCTDYEVEDLNPTVCGVPNVYGNSGCAYGSSYSDVMVTNCDDLNSIVRSWAVIDWCTSSVITSDINGTSNIQLITLEDVTPPVIGEAVVEVQAGNNCYGLGFVGIEPIIDDCQSVDIGLFVEGFGELDYTFDSDGNINGGNINEPGLELGTYQLLITATDACGNYSEKSLAFDVIDDQSPVAICEDEFKVTLNSSGNANISASLFDYGSFDNCCLNSVLVKRIGSGLPFETSLSFDCSDIAESPISIDLYVDDCNGNSNNCQFVLNVFDEAAPTVLGPDNMEIDCVSFYSNYQLILDSILSISNPSEDAFSFLNDSFGVAVFSDNCSIQLDHDVSYTLDDCGNGQIRRFWAAKDQGELDATTYTQFIDVNHVADWNVQFPEDWEGVAEFGCTDFQTFGEPLFEGLDCEQFSVSFEDVLFTDEPNSCYRILRKWTVINNCTFHPDFSQDLGVDIGDRKFNVTGTNFKTYLQSIKILNTVISTDSFLSDTSYVLMGMDCDATLVMPLPKDINCDLLSVNIESTDLSPYPSIGGQVYFDVPPGIYTAKYIIEDLCGNQKEEIITIEMLDGLAPSLMCPEEHIVYSEATLSGAAWEQSFSMDDLSVLSNDNCGFVELKFLDENGQKVDELGLNCNLLGHQWIDIVAMDSNGNESSCTMKLLIKDDENVCEDNLFLSGEVQTVGGQGMNNVDLYIEGYGNTVTYSTGDYVFAGLDPQDQLFIEPSYKGLDPLNGISTLDIVMISKHVLSIDVFDDLESYIAADVNFSNSVSTLDIVKLQRLILGIDSELEGGQSWRFVDSDYVFDPADIWGFEEYILLDSIEENRDVSFTGIKIGDVNASVIVD